MAHEPIKVGTSSYQKLFDLPAGAGTRVRTYQCATVDVDTLLSTFFDGLAVVDYEVSASPGSAIATVRITYEVISGSLVLGERRPPVYALTPQMVPVDLRAAPQFAGITKEIPIIEMMINSVRIGDIAAKYIGNADALKFARLLIAGITSYESPAFTLTVTRYYTTAPDLSTDYANINKVFTWATISTGGQTVPGSITEPKWVDPTGTAQAFSWRLTSVAPVIQRGQLNTVQWQFFGCQKWAKWLYSGGQYEPGDLT